MNITSQHVELPSFAREELMRAAQTPVTGGDPYARSRAIDRVIEKLKREYPQCFLPEAWD